MYKENIQISIVVHNRDITLLIVWFLFFLYTVFDFIRYWKQNKPIKFDILYYRDHRKNYSPSMVCLLMTLKVDISKCLLSDILYLNNEKCIYLDYEKKTCVITDKCPTAMHLKFLWDIIAKNPSIRLDKLLNSSCFLEEKMNYQMACYQEGVNLGMIKKAKTGVSILAYILKWSLGLWLFLFLGSLISSTYTLMEAFLLSVIFTLGISICILGPLSLFLVVIKLILAHHQVYVRTTLGKDDVRYWYGFVNFLNDFTRIHEKSFEYNILLDQVYPYAVSLGINKVAEKS